MKPTVKPLKISATKRGAPMEKTSFKECEKLSPPPLFTGSLKSFNGKMEDKRRVKVKMKISFGSISRRKPEIKGPKIVPIPSTICIFP